MGLQPESEFVMTDPISNQRPAPNPGARRATDQVQRNPVDKAARNDKPAQMPVATANEPVAQKAGADQLILSNVMQRAKDAQGFDPAKVQSIKKAIQDGQYPLDPRRIAESFNALERMIRD